MDTLLVLLGVLGIGAIIIAIHVLTMAPGSHGYGPGKQAGQFGVDDGFSERKEADRRGVLVVAFPLLINGTLVREERRSLEDRRQPPTT